MKEAEDALKTTWRSMPVRPLKQRWDFKGPRLIGPNRGIQTANLKSLTADTKPKTLTKGPRRDFSLKSAARAK